MTVSPRLFFIQYREEGTMADRKEGEHPKGSSAGKGMKIKSSGGATPSKTGSAKAGGKGSSSAGAKKSPNSSAAPAKSNARTKQPDLKKDLRDFASGRPQGWGHDDWLNFLESLKSRGHDVADREAIGVALERERLDLALSGVKG